MALFEFHVPDEDGWEDSLASRIMFIMVGLLLFRMGFRIWAGLMPEYHVGAVATVVLFAVGTQLMIFAAMDPTKLDLEVWGPRITYAVLAAVFLAGTVALHLTFIDKIGTDALLFSQIAVDQLVNHGQNPFTVDMAPHVQAWKGPQYATPRINGEIVRQLSYPAGAVVWFLPQYLTVGATGFGIRLTLWLMAFATSIVVIESLPRKLAIAGVACLWATRNMWMAAAGGVIWPLWVLPLALGLRAWAGERWLWAAFWIGIAAGSKQHAWAVLPFLAIWVWKESPDLRTFGERALKLNAVGGAAFLALNAPFMVWNIHAWVDGVLTPVSTKAPMVHQGMGLAVFPFVGTIPLPTWWYSLGTVLAGSVAMLAYYLYFDQLKWAAWVLPPAILFFHSRNLMSYFTTWGPLAVLAAAAVWGRLQTGPILSLDTDRDRHRREVVADD